MKCGYTIAVGDVKDYPCLKCGDLILNLKEAIEVQADTVEVHLSDPEELDIKQINGLIDGRLGISALGSGLSCGKYKLSLTSPDEAVRKKTQKKLKAYIDAAEDLASVVIIGSIRGRNEQGLSLEEYEELFIKSLIPVIDYAEEHNTDLVIETISRYELPFYNTIAEMTRLIKRINRSNVKVHIDTFHMNLEELNVYESVAGIGELLGHVHMADNTRLIPGSGTFAFKELKKALDHVGFSSMSMECFNPGFGQDNIIKGLHYIKSL